MISNLLDLLIMNPASSDCQVLLEELQQDSSDCDFWPQKRAKQVSVVSVLFAGVWKNVEWQSRGAITFSMKYLPQQFGHSCDISTVRFTA